MHRHTGPAPGIMVWGGIRYHSRTPLVRIAGILNSQRYISEVLVPVVLPYLQDLATAIFQQDNATAAAGSDLVQSGRPIFDDFFQHLWPYIGNNTANIVFQIVKRLWLIRIDQ
ncbi:transposable element Tcb1 transposase [Trichonephila clavipes]|uniref:Transposable element Tcb1 transposase n=1 Tax=Trichonephila clavipes TaxID=2585209 RepID=A0A8X7BA48_TRICX|nr:transposable element Tcb1 transposase [Trichonephila clavipes]